MCIHHKAGERLYVDFAGKTMQVKLLSVEIRLVT